MKLLGTITFEGKTYSDVEMAIEETLRRIKEGYSIGTDSTEDGKFTFEISTSTRTRKKE